MSEVQYPENVAAGGSVTGATGAINSGSRGIAGVERVSAGVYRVTLAEQLDPVEYVAAATLRGSTEGIVSVTPAGDGVVEVRTWSVGGGGGGPEVLGVVDGMTVPGAVSWNGYGVDAIEKPTGLGEGVYDLTLSTPIDLAPDGDGALFMTLRADAVPPDNNTWAFVARYIVIDDTHVRVACESYQATRKNSIFSLAIYRLTPSGGAVATAADLDFNLAVWRVNVNNS